MRLHYSANPQLNPDTPEGKQRIADLRNLYISDAQWRKEMEIDAHALEGARVYPEFSRSVHVLPHAAVKYIDAECKIKRRGCCFMAIDPHPRTPHAALWVMIDRWQDWYIYRELWPSIAYGLNRSVRDTDQENFYTVREYAGAIAHFEGNEIEWRNAEKQDEYGVYRKKENGERILERRCDQAGKGFYEKGSTSSIWATYSDYGLPLLEPRKQHAAGEDAVHQLLKPRRHNQFGEWPRLHISDQCQELILELELYRYRQMKRIDDNRELFQQGVEARCHMIDALRYLATADLYYSASQEGEIH